MSSPRARKSNRALAAALAAWLCATAATPARAQSAADTAAARDLFHQASRLAQEGRWQEASDHYERSLKLKRASLTLYSLGVAQAQTGHFVEARESLLSFLAEPSTPATKPFEQPARDAVQDLSKRVARLTLTITPARAPHLSVTMDGSAVPLEALDMPRLINPGQHTISVSADGHLPLQKNVKVREGDTLTLTLALQPAPRRPEETKAPPPLLLASDRTIPLVLIGTGLATFAAGLTTGLGSVIDASGAPTSDGPEADLAKSKALLGDVVSGVGLSAAAAGVVWLIVMATSDSPKPKTGAAAPLTAHIEASPGGIQLRF